MHEKSKILKDLLKQVKGKSDENKELDRKLRELQVSVAERAQIEKLAGKTSIKSSTKLAWFKQCTHKSKYYGLPWSSSSPSLIKFPPLKFD